MSQQPRYRYVAVLAMGRSGTTLVQGVLNSDPRVLVRGENADYLGRSFRGYHGLQVRGRRYDRSKRHDDVTHPWYGWTEWDFKGLARATGDAFVDHVIQPGPDLDVVGFKEIRYYQHGRDQGDYLAYLMEALPGIRFVVNLRNANSIKASGFWVDYDMTAERIQEEQERLVESAQHSGAPYVVIRYEDYVAEPTALQPVFDLIERPFDLNAVQRTLATPHSYNQNETK